MAYNNLSVSEIRISLPKIKRQLQLGKKRIAITFYGQVVGVLVPLKDVEGAERENAAHKVKDISLSDFRANINKCWESLHVDVDCIYLTYHRRRAAAFVSPRLASHLGIPISEFAQTLLSINSGLTE